MLLKSFKTYRSERKITKQFGNIESSFEAYVSEAKNVKLDFWRIAEYCCYFRKIGLSKHTIIDIFWRCGYRAFYARVYQKQWWVSKKALEIFEDVMFEMLSDDGLVYKKVNDYYEFSNVFLDEIEVMT